MDSGRGITGGGSGYAAILAHAGGALYGTELGSVTLKRIGFFCFPIKHSTHTQSLPPSYPPPEAGSEGRRWLVNATMMNVHMVNEIEGYLQLGRQNADNLGLTELLSSSLSSSPVVARLCLGCKAYVHRKVVRRIDSFLPTNRLGIQPEQSRHGLVRSYEL